MSESQDEPRENEADMTSDDEPEVDEANEGEEGDTGDGDHMPDGISALLDVGSEE